MNLQGWADEQVLEKINRCVCVWNRHNTLQHGAAPACLPGVISNMFYLSFLTLLHHLSHVNLTEQVHFYFKHVNNTFRCTHGTRGVWGRRESLHRFICLNLTAEHGLKQSKADTGQQGKNVMLDMTNKCQNTHRHKLGGVEESTSCNKYWIFIGCIVALTLLDSIRL